MAFLFLQLKIRALTIDPIPDQATSGDIPTYFRNIGMGSCQRDSGQATSIGFGVVHVYCWIDYCSCVHGLSRSWHYVSASQPPVFRQISEHLEMEWPSPNVQTERSCLWSRYGGGSRGFWPYLPMDVSDCACGLACCIPKAFLARSQC